MKKSESDLLQLIKTRRSVFPISYINKPIEKETLVEILECADQAPNHKLTQPWRFKVFTGQGLVKLANELVKQYKQITPKETFLQKKSDSISEKILQSSAVMAICLQESGKVPKWEEIAGVASAVQNMSLAASALGIGSYGSSPPMINEVGSFLQLKENESCIGFFYMGYHEEVPRLGSRSPLEEKVTWIS